MDAFEWAPDGKKLALLIKDPSPEEIEAQKHKDAGTKPVREKAPPVSVVDRLQIKRDYEGYLDRRRTHLYVFDLASKKPAQVTSGDHDDRDPAWSPDGRFLAFVSNHTEDPDANYDSNVWVVAADNPDKGKTLIQVTTNPGDDDQPAWSPDGKWIAYVTNPEPKILWYATDAPGPAARAGRGRRQGGAEAAHQAARPQRAHAAVRARQREHLLPARGRRRGAPGAHPGGGRRGDAAHRRRRARSAVRGGQGRHHRRAGQRSRSTRTRSSC